MTEENKDKAQQQKAQQNNNQKQNPQEKAPLTEEEINEQMQVRIGKMHKLAEDGIAPFGHKFPWTYHAKDVDEHLDELEANATEVKLAGRIMAIRGHGKTA